MKRLIRTTRIVDFPFTNESLPAIRQGMDIKRNDRICAICGSLDQALAMLEYAAEVTAVDYDAKQAAFADYKAGLIRDGNFEEFFNPMYHPDHAFVRDSARIRRNEYFSKKGRLERIRKRLNRLEIRFEKDFIHALTPGRFTKAYLSNILGHHGFKEKPSEQKEYVKKIIECLESPKLIYIANDLSAQLKDFNDILERDNGLTAKAIMLEPVVDVFPSAGKKHRWHPAVYRAI
ncbi:MAG: hypothetical protein KJ955_00615 [Nanoarchaeota archaeon]|nr:hypothetical protein [Nanoarchaeota archaeon]